MIRSYSKAEPVEGTKRKTRPRHNSMLEVQIYLRCLVKAYMAEGAPIPTTLTVGYLGNIGIIPGCVN